VQHSEEQKKRGKRGKSAGRSSERAAARDVTVELDGRFHTARHKRSCNELELVLDSAWAVKLTTEQTAARGHELELALKAPVKCDIF
jgi:hypothetical protein